MRYIHASTTKSIAITASTYTKENGRPRTRGSTRLPTAVYTGATRDTADSTKKAIANRCRTVDAEGTGFGIIADVKFDLVDRRCIVTGASSGIGKEIARNLAYFGATVVLACRDRDRGSAALQEIAEDSGNDRLSLLMLDLSARASIRAFVQHVTAGGMPVHVLVNNAGTFVSERTLDEAGHELTWATNVLGPFALTNLLVESLVKSSPSRVVNVASKLAGGLVLDDVHFEKRRYSGVKAYKQSKQANRMLSWGLQARIGDSVSVTACHPGGVNTRIYDNLTGVASAFMNVGRRFLKAPAEGARTPTRLAADPKLGNLRAEFWANEAAATCKFRDEAAIDALWSSCVEMTHIDS